MIQKTHSFNFRSGKHLLSGRVGGELVEIKQGCSIGTHRCVSTTKWLDVTDIEFVKYHGLAIDPIQEETQHYRQTP